jgi:large subunit ribosomal protein L30
MNAERLLVRQVRGVAGRPWQQRLVLKGLGLRGPGSEVVVQNERAMRGMIRKVLHLVAVEEVAGKEVATKAPATKAPATKEAPAAKPKAAAGAPKKGKS